MGKVHVVKITTANFEALQYKDEDVLYFVNDTGTFSPESLETDGRVYLGDKPLLYYVALSLASGKKVYYNGNDITSAPNLGAIVANAQHHWNGSQAAYDKKVQQGTVQQGVAYFIDPQPDWNETNTESLAYIKNKPNIMDMEVVSETARFEYR